MFGFDTQGECPPALLPAYRPTRGELDLAGAIVTREAKSASRASKTVQLARRGPSKPAHPSLPTKFTLPYAEPRS